MLKLSQENQIFDLPDLNRFRIGDQVIVDASADNDRFEGVIIGIEMNRRFSSGPLEPSITLLHDGYITDGFKPIDCRKVEPPAPAPKLVPPTQGMPTENVLQILNGLLDEGSLLDSQALAVRTAIIRLSPPTSDAIERVAKAIYEADDVWSEAFPWPTMGSDYQSADNYRRIARAALDAAPNTPSPVQNVLAPVDAKERKE